MKSLQGTLYQVTLIILAIVAILSVDKVSNTYYYYIKYHKAMNPLDNKVIISGILISITIVLILLCIIYTLAYSRSNLNIPFKAPYFLIAIIFVAFPLFISLTLINSFEDILSTNIVKKKELYFQSILPNSMIALNFCFIFLTLFVLEVFKTERKYFDKEFSKQSMALLIFYGTGFFFTNTIIGLLYKVREDYTKSAYIDLLLYFSITALIVSLLYLFLAVAFEMKIKFQVGFGKK